MSELKECPFCGEGARVVIEKDEGINFAVCAICGEWAKVEIWNTRPIEDELRQTIADLKERAGELATELFGYVGTEGILGKAALENYFSLLKKLEDK